jgi:hypothetical protein
MEKVGESIEIKQNNKLRQRINIGKKKRSRLNY